MALIVACSTTVDAPANTETEEGTTEEVDEGTTEASSSSSGPSTSEDTSTSSSTSTTSGVGTMASRCESEDDGWGGEDDGSGEGSSGTSGAEDTTFGMGDDMPLLTSVYEVQEGRLRPGDFVLLPAVIVTSPSIPSETGRGYELFVQEQDGGPFSGLRVRLLFDPGVTLPHGQTVDLVGDVYEQAGHYLLEVADPDWATPVQAGVVPEPVLLMATELEANDPSARLYDAVPVRVEQVTVTDAEPCVGEFEVDGVLRIDDRFTPSGLPEPAQGQVITAVEGVLVYAFDLYELAPIDPDGVE